MTDMQKFFQLYNSLGIILEADPISNPSKDREAFSITIEEGMYDKITGYCGFMTVIYFDKDENFISQGFWE